MSGAAKTGISPTTGPTRRHRLLWGGATAIGVLVASHVTLALNPSLLFAHEIRASNVVLHARAPLPAAAADIATEALTRISTSPFYDPGDRYDVYLCDTPALFAFFALWDRNAGAISQVYVTGNVFMRPSDVGRDLLYGPSGNAAEAPRTLTYFITHELAHTMVSRRLGRLAYSRLAVWQQEGYADYLGKGGEFDFPSVLLAFKTGEKEIDPAASGLYLRYHLLAEFLIHHRGVKPEALLNSYREPAPIEAELRALP